MNTTFEGSGITPGTPTSYHSTTLQDILSKTNAPKHIDYLNLDCEGCETTALQNFDFDEHVILTMTVERPDNVLQQLLIEKGYVKLGYHGFFGDEFYILGKFFDLDIVQTRLQEFGSPYFSKDGEYQGD